MLREFVKTTSKIAWTAIITILLSTALSPLLGRIPAVSKSVMPLVFDVVPQREKTAWIVSGLLFLAWIACLVIAFDLKFRQLHQIGA